MRPVLTTVAMLAGALTISGCGSSGHRAVFTKLSRVGALSVPTPSGFHSRTWPGGVVITDRAGAIPVPCTTNDGCAGGVAGFPRQDELVVYETSFHETPPALRLPLTLQKLRQMSDGLTEWDGAGSIGGRGTYAVEVWLGPKAPAAHRSALLSALKSVKPT